MMRKKEKVITMTVTLILVVILICIKVTHLVIIERPLKQCRIVSAYHLTVDTNGAQIDQSWLFEKDDLTYKILPKLLSRHILSLIMLVVLVIAVHSMNSR